MTGLTGCIPMLPEPALSSRPSAWSHRTRQASNRFLQWAARLQQRAQYLIVENSASQHTSFRYWRESAQALEFQRVFHPAVIQMDYRLPELENASRNHGVTLGRSRTEQRTRRNCRKRRSSCALKAIAAACSPSSTA